MSGQREGSRHKLEINPVQVTASALAAVTSAVLLSTLGTAGTIIGAAIGSLIATAGAAIYSYSLRIGRERVAAAQAAAIAKVNRRRAGQSTIQVEVAERAAEGQKRPPWREAFSRLPWKWIAILAGAVFVVAMLVIIGFELLTGRSVSTYTGGSDGGGHRTSLGFGSSTKASQSPTPTPTPTPSSSSTPQRTAAGKSAVPGRSSRPSSGSSPSTSPSASLPTPSSSAPARSTPSSSPSD